MTHPTDHPSSPDRPDGPPGPDIGSLQAQGQRPAAVLLSLSASFALIGASVAMYGPLTPDLISSGVLPAAWGGAVVGAHSSGALVAVAACAAATGPASLRWRPPFAALVLASGGVVIATATGAAEVLAGAVLVGAGFGTLASDLNAAAVRRFTNGPVVVNGLNAAFGCGAVGAPLLLATTGARPASAFAALAVLALACAPLLALTAERESRTQPTPVAVRGVRPVRPAYPPWRRLVLVGAAAAVEASLVAWGANAVIAAGGSVAAASAAMSGHFAVFVLARLACVPLSGRQSPQRLLAGSLTLTAGSLGLMTLGPSAAVGLVAAGVIGAAFPNALLWSLAPADRRISPALGTPMIVMAAMVGGLLGPLGSGLAAAALTTGPLTVTAVLAAVVAAALLQASRSNAAPLIAGC
ncbi:hypothetical protein [Jannaschia sp. R86511]|uniref:hypothetical protein n=1 Tax=Jannaschia sp. R86511 TaxID=3093853 RepID=UPI0036D39468